MNIRKYVHLALWLKRHLMGELKPIEFDAITSLFDKDSICIDVGGHSGSWAYNLLST